MCMCSILLTGLLHLLLLHDMSLGGQVTYRHGIRTRSTHTLARYSHAASRTWSHATWYTPSARLHAHHSRL